MSEIDALLKEDRRFPPPEAESLRDRINDAQAVLLVTADGTSTKPGSATLPFPGVSAEIRDARGTHIETGGGLLALSKPWPSMLRGIADPNVVARLKAEYQEDE